MSSDRRLIEPQLSWGGFSDSDGSQRIQAISLQAEFHPIPAIERRLKGGPNA